MFSRIGYHLCLHLHQKHTLTRRGLQWSEGQSAACSLVQVAGNLPDGSLTTKKGMEASSCSILMMFDTRIGQLSQMSLPVCRDRGMWGGRAGALCLSFVGWYDPFVSGDSMESYCDEDRHKAPALPHIRPLSLQEVGRMYPVFNQTTKAGV